MVRAESLPATLCAELLLLFVQGYYARFFHEGRKIGAGGFGGVWLTHHALDGVELGARGQPTLLELTRCVCLQALMVIHLSLVCAR